MTKKDKFIQNVSELKDKASQIGGDAKKTLGKIKDVVQTGITTSKSAIQKAGETVNKQKLGDGINKASSGVDIMAKGARLASKGATSLANTMESASEKMRKMSDKLKKK